MVRPSRQNTHKHRAALLLKGYTVTAFAKAHHFPLSTVKAAISGNRAGPKSREVLKAIRDAAGCYHS